MWSSPYIYIVDARDRFTTYLSVIMGAIYTVSLFNLAYDVNKNDTISRQYLTIHHCESIMKYANVGATFVPPSHSVDLPSHRDIRIVMRLTLYQPYK